MKLLIHPILTQTLYNYIVYITFALGLILVYLSWNFSTEIILLFSHPKFLSYASFLHLFILSGILFGLSRYFTKDAIKNGSKITKLCKINAWIIWNNY